MFQKINLHELAELRGAERAFLSLYAPGNRAKDLLHEREERIRAFLSDEPDELEHFNENVKLLQSALDDNPETLSSEGVALFACWALDRVHGFPLAVEVPELVRVGPSPHIKPLAELQDEYETFVVVVADNHGAHIELVAGAQVTDEERVHADVKNRVKKGGWSQKRYARRREKELHLYAKEVVERLQEMDKKTDFDRVVLLGSKEAMEEIEKTLPQPLREKLVGKRSVDVNGDEDAMLEEAFELFFEEERRSEQRLWDRIKNEYMKDGLAVAGATKVLDAVKVGRVDALVVTRDAEIQGTRCRDCENVVHGTPKTCQICGSKSVFPVDLVEELVDHAARTDARVDFADPISGLTEVGDVAALLRY